MTQLIHDTTRGIYHARLADGRAIEIDADQVDEAREENPHPEEALVAENWLAAEGVNPCVRVEPAS